MVEYSGYDTAGPTDPIPYYIAQALGTTCRNCGDPNLLPDSATAVGSVLARMVGFATVSVQMRGTGCSGGAFDLFGYPSDYDAYDAIEIIAHQSWVANHKVGMVGISYSGLSQLPAAGTDPPGLAAIAPMSPTDDLFSTGYPGGIYNDGFAASWISARIDDAMAAAGYSDGHLVPLATTPVTNVGQPWTYYEIDAELAASGGASSTCLANQALHNEAEGLESLVGPQIVAPGTGSGRDPSLFDRRSMIGWAGSVNVPVFLAGALQDEQTGPQWPALIDAIPKTTPLVRQHGQRRPHRLHRSADPHPLAGVPGHLCGRRGPDPAEQPRRDLPRQVRQRRLGHFNRSTAPGHPVHPGTEPRGSPSGLRGQHPLVQVLFDNGAGAPEPGHIESTYSAGFSSWPPAGQITTLYLGGHGSAADRRTPPCTRTRPSSWTRRRGPPPAFRPAATHGRPIRAGTGRRFPPPTASAFQTPPFTTDTTIVGPGHPRPLGPLGDAGGGLPGHHHRGPADGGPGRVCDLGVPAQLQPGGQSRLHVALHGPDVPGRGRPAPSRRRRTRW